MKPGDEIVVLGTIVHVNANGTVDIQIDDQVIHRVIPDVCAHVVKKIKKEKKPK